MLVPRTAITASLFSNRMIGCHLQDATGDQSELPPGQGEVDFQLVSEYVPREAARVVEVHPRHGRAEVLTAVQFLLTAWNDLRAVREQM